MTRRAHPKIGAAGTGREWGPIFSGGPFFCPHLVREDRDQTGRSEEGPVHASCVCSVLHTGARVPQGLRVPDHRILSRKPQCICMRCPPGVSHGHWPTGLRSTRPAWSPAHFPPLLPVPLARRSPAFLYAG